MPRIDRLWYEIDAETRGFDEGILQSGSKLRSFTEYAKGAPLAVLGALGAAAVVAGVKLARMAADVEKQMAIVNTVAQVTQGTLADLQRGVLQVFTDLPIEDVNDLTRGLYDIVSSGVAVGESLDFLRVAAEGAVGGVTSVAIVVDALTGITNAYRAENLQAKDALDQIHQAVAVGKGEFQDYASTIGNVIGIAASMNISLSDVLSTLAALSLQSIKTAEGVTGLRSAIINISRPSEEFKQQFPELAAAFTEGRLRGDGFVKFLLDFQRESKGSSAALSSLFRDTQAYTAVVSLLKDGGAGLVSVQQQVAESAGAAAKATDIMKDTSEAAAQKIRNELKVELIELGSTTLPLVNEGMEVFSGLMRDLQDILASGPDAGVTRFRNNIKGLATDIEDGGRDVVSGVYNWITASDRLGQLGRTLNEQPDVLKNLGQEGIAELGKALDDLEKKAALLTPAMRATIRALRDGIAAANADVAAAGKASAAEAGKASAERAKGIAAEVDATRALAGEVAGQITNYKGEAAAHVVAQRQKTAALKAVSAAQAELAQAGKDAADAAARGDEQGALGAKRRAEAARSSIEAQRETVLNANKVLTEFARQVQDKVASLDAQLRGAIARATVSAVDDAEAAIADLLVQVEKVRRDGGIIDQAQVDRVVAMTRSAAELKDALAATDRALADVQQREFRGEQDLERLSAEAAKLRLLRDQVESAADLLEINQRLREIDRERRDISADIVENQRAITDAIARILQRQSAEVRDLAGALNDSASAALSLAGAMGIVDDQMVSVLQSAVQIGTQISVFQDELGKLGKTDGAGNALASIGSVVSAALPIIGGLSSILGAALGDSPAEQERKRLQRENIAALRELTKQLGEFGLEIVGEEFARFSEIVNVAVAAGNREGRDSSSGIERQGERQDIRGFLRAQGIDPQELRDFAASLGISFESLIPTFAELRVLAEAIAATELTQFAVTFGGQLQALRAEFRLFNIKDPIAQLEKLRDVFSDPKFGAPALRQALAGLDLSTPEGRAAAQKALEGLFQQLQAGTLDPSQLGGLTAQELLDAILETSELLRTESADGPEGTGGFNVSRTITEVTGSRIGGLLTTANIWAQQTAENTAIMAAALASAAGSPSLTAPAVAPFVTDSGVRGMQQFIVNLNIPAGMTPQQAGEIGAAITDPLITEMDRQLGLKMQRRTRANGSALLTS